ncbi:V-type ATP synthase subunit F [Catenulispora subtropica]|uniref:ATP synthase F subunit n=1 Tax=Catenulispora subtropica TaxID=450798 RepID=A0ABP5EU88_9ACTN
MAAGRVAALGEWALIRGFALAGVRTVTAADPEAVRAAWASLDRDVAVVILTPSAAGALGEAVRRGPLTVVLP